MMKSFWILCFACLILLPQIVTAQNNEQGSMPAQIFVTDVALESEQVNAGDTVPARISLINRDAYANSGFYILLGFTDSADAYADYVYSYATTALPLMEGNSSVEITVPVRVPKLQNGSSTRIQAQVFNISGLPFGFGKSRDVVVRNSDAKNSQATRVLISSLVGDDVNEREVVIQNIRVSTSTEMDKLIVDVIFNGTQATSQNMAQVIRDRWRKDGQASTTPPFDPEKVVVAGETVLFNISVLDGDGKQVHISTETKLITVGMNNLEFSNIQIPDSEPGVVVKIQALKGDSLLDEKTFSITNVQMKPNNTGFIVGIIALVLLIIFFVIRKFRLGRGKFIIGLFVVATLLFVFTGQLSVAQSGSDAYVQSSKGTNTFQIYAYNEIFTLLSNTAGGVFDPGSVIPVTASMRGSTNNWGFSYNTYALTLKTNGISSGKLGGCIFGPANDPDFIEWANDIENDMSGDSVRTFNDTATGIWTGPVSFNGTYWQTGTDEFTNDYTRCIYTPTVEIVAPTIPGRYKMDIESVFGGPSQSGSAPHPMIGEYRRGALYYYVRPAAPVITITTTACADRIALSWEAVPGATSYNVYRSTSENGTYTLLSPTTQTSYEDFPTIYNTPYYYKVTAKLDAYNLESSYSNQVSGQRVVPSCNLDRCTNIDGVQSDPAFSAHNRDYFYSIVDDTLYFAPAAATYGAGGVVSQACAVDMCANTETIESAIPTGQDWDRNNADPYTRYSCSAPPETVCDCSGRTHICLEGGIVVSSTPDAPQCSLDASCSYAVNGSDVTFSFFATNILGSITNATPVTQSIPTIGSGTLSSGNRTIGNTGDDQTDITSCTYAYSNFVPPCPDAANPACDVECNPATDPFCPVGDDDPGILGFTATPIVEQGGDCVFYWATQHMSSCNLGPANSGSAVYNTGPGKNITQTLVCQSDEAVPRTFSAVEQCLVRPNVTEQ